MNKFLAGLSVIIILSSCSNTPDMETGEIKTLQILRTVFDETNKPNKFIDARNLINREQIDDANTAVLFVELASGQNGTLTPYPGQGDGQTWLGADGAIITLEKGILKASRGMGDDLMGSSSSMPRWSKVNKKTEIYIRKLAHITGNNKIVTRVFNCDIEKSSSIEFIVVWDVSFKVTKFEETCFNSNLTFKNTYHVDNKGIVRRSMQYHSDTIGYIITERLDR